MGKLSSGGDFVDKKATNDSFDTNVVAPTEEGIANIANMQLAPTKDISKSSISESYVIEHNTVK